MASNTRGSIGVVACNSRRLDTLVLNYLLAIKFSFASISECFIQEIRTTRKKGVVGGQIHLSVQIQRLQLWLRDRRKASGGCSRHNTGDQPAEKPRWQHFLCNYFHLRHKVFYLSLTAADAQDAGGSYFKHILLCTTSVAFGHWASLVSVSGTYGA